MEAGFGKMVLPLPQHSLQDTPASVYHFTVHRGLIGLQSMQSTPSQEKETKPQKQAL